MVTSPQLKKVRRPSTRRESGRAGGPAAISRLIRLHQALAAGRRFTVPVLAHELEMSTRTVKRDIERLRDFHQAPIIWDASAKTYRYSASFDLLTGLRLDADELMAIVLAGHTFSAWGGSPLGKALTQALSKVARFAGHAISIPADRMRECLFGLDTPLAVDAGSRWFAQLLDCVLHSHEIRLAYRKPGSPKTETRVVQPLHLAYLDHRWMLLAHDTGKKAWRNFVLDRIEALELKGRRFISPPREEIRCHLAGSLGRFTGEKEFEVRLVFTPTAAPYLRERPWHPSQTIIDRPGGEIEVTLRLNNLVDVERRILANGRHVEVLAPAELRASVAEEAAALLARHR